MLRVNGPEVYDQWVTHEIPFNDPKVAAALDEVGKFLKNENYVNGGYGDVKSIASTTFQDGGLTILDGTCAMHRQATFYASQFPEGTTVAEDGDVFAFYLPGGSIPPPSRSSVVASSSLPTRIVPRSLPRRSGCRRRTTPTAWRRTAPGLPARTSTSIRRCTPA